MKRATITISDQLEPALEAYLKDQEVAPSLTRLLQTALGEFLSARGYGGSKKRAGTAVSRTEAAETRSRRRPAAQPRVAEVEGAQPEPAPEDPTLL